MMGHPFDCYRTMVVETATPVELVVKLYRGVLRFGQQAVEALERGDHEDAHACLTRAQAIIAELSESLDLDNGGQLAVQLLTLYTYSTRLLAEANCQKAVEPVRGVLELFRELLPAWQAISDSPVGTRLTPTLVLA
jgi:flagellar protein FliS